jgi:hypothetical protein
MHECISERRRGKGANMDMEQVTFIHAFNGFFFIVSHSVSVFNNGGKIIFKKIISDILKNCITFSFYSKAHNHR